MVVYETTNPEKPLAKRSIRIPLGPRKGSGTLVTSIYIMQNVQVMLYQNMLMKFTEGATVQTYLPSQQQPTSIANTLLKSISHDRQT